MNKEIFEGFATMGKAASLAAEAASRFIGALPEKRNLGRPGDSTHYGKEERAAKKRQRLARKRAR